MPVAQKIERPPPGPPGYVTMAARVKVEMERIDALNVSSQEKIKQFDQWIVNTSGMALPKTDPRKSKLMSEWRSYVHHSLFLKSPFEKLVLDAKTWGLNSDAIFRPWLPQAERGVSLMPQKVGPLDTLRRPTKIPDPDFQLPLGATIKIQFFNGHGTRPGTLGPAGNPTWSFSPTNQPPWQVPDQYISTAHVPMGEHLLVGTVRNSANKIIKQFNWSAYGMPEFALQGDPQVSFTVSAQPQSYKLGSDNKVTFSVRNLAGNPISVLPTGVTTPNGETDDILIMLFDTSWAQIGSFGHTMKKGPWEIDPAKLNAIPAGQYLLQFIPRVATTERLVHYQPGKMTANLTITPADVVVEPPKPAPDIEISHAGSVIESGTFVADWGEVQPKSPAKDKRFEVKNVGDKPLLLQGIVPPPGFVLMDGMAVPELAPGGTEDFVVRMPTHTPVSLEGDLFFNSNDPDEGPFIIRLKGKVAGEIKPPQFTSSGGEVKVAPMIVGGKLRMIVSIQSIDITEV